MIDLFSLLMFFLLILRIEPHIKCYIGYGQRGRQYSSQVLWERTCHESKYCFEATTGDINSMVSLIDYPWDAYYSQFWVKGCGGEWGTPYNIHPYKAYKGTSYGKFLRQHTRTIHINISSPATVTIPGGKFLFDLEYECRRELCNDISGKILIGDTGDFVLTHSICIVRFPIVKSDIFAIDDPVDARCCLTMHLNISKYFIIIYARKKAIYVEYSCDSLFK